MDDFDTTICIKYTAIRLDTQSGPLDIISVGSFLSEVLGPIGKPITLDLNSTNSLEYIRI